MADAGPRRYRQGEGRRVVNAAAMTLPADRETVEAPPTFCPLCDGRGEFTHATCRACDGAGLAKCRACLDPYDLVTPDGVRTVCRACLGSVAWRCDECGIVEAVAKPDGGAIDSVFCAQCGRDAELVTCKHCGCALEDADESVCDDCAEPYCQHCAGSGEGSHDGARCFACKGDGVER